MKSSSSHPRLKLMFSGARLESTEYVREPDALPVRASTLGHPRHTKIQWCGQAVALVQFLLYQVAWALTDPKRAVQEIEDAVQYRRGCAESAPVFVGPARSRAATLSEAIRACRSACIEGVFGDWLWIGDTFHQRVKPFFAVCLDVRHLSPLNIEIVVDGVEVVDANILLDLAGRIRKPARRAKAPRSAGKNGQAQPDHWEEILQPRDCWAEGCGNRDRRSLAAIPAPARSETRKRQAGMSGKTCTGRDRIPAWRDPCRPTGSCTSTCPHFGLVFGLPNDADR